MKAFYPLLLAAAIMAAGCTSDSRHRLSLLVAETQKSLPEPVTEQISVQSVDYDRGDNMVKIVILTNGMTDDINRWSSDKDFNALAIKSITKASADAEHDIVKAASEAGAGISLQWTDSRNPDTTPTVFSARELDELLRQVEAGNSADEVLRDFISIINLRCPESLDGSDLVMTNVALTASDIEFHINTRNYDIAAAAPSLRPSLREGFLSDISQSDNGEVLSAMHDKGIGVAYVFHPLDSMAPCTISFSIDELIDK